VRLQRTNSNIVADAEEAHVQELLSKALQPIDASDIRY
jgi:hypothetical protein